MKPQAEIEARIRKSTKLIEKIASEINAPDVTYGLRDMLRKRLLIEVVRRNALLWAVKKPGKKYRYPR